MSSNDEMYIFHYSNRNLLTVLSEYAPTNDEFSFSLSSTNQVNLMKNHDPIVTISKNDKIRGGRIIKITKPNITIKLDKKCSFVEKRLYKRVPVSMIATFKTFESHMRHVGKIKDISKNGMLMLCEKIIPVESSVVIEIILEGKIVFIEAQIVRRAESENIYQYGLAVPSYDVLSLNNLGNLLKTVVVYYRKKIPNTEEYQSFFDELDFPNTPTEDVNREMLNYCVKRFEEILKRSRY